MADTQGKVPEQCVVIVPGYMGSKLRDRNNKKIVWANSSDIPWLRWRLWLDRMFRTLEYPNDNLEPWGIMDEVIFIPPWAKMENYERLVKKLDGFGYAVDLRQCFGYEGDQVPYDESQLNVYAFAYDWRQDNRKSARQLGAAIDRWRQFHPGAEVWIVAHSNGGVVARWFIWQEGRQLNRPRPFFIGSPR